LVGKRGTAVGCGDTRLRTALIAVVVAMWAGMAGPVGALGAPTVITEFPVAVGHPSNLAGLVAGPDGHIWFGDSWWPEGSYHALIGRMDGVGSVQEFDEGLSKFSSPEAFVAGPDGNVWFADAGSTASGASIGRVAPDGDITRFTAGLGGSRPRTIIVGPDGNLWFTAAGSSPAIGFATPDGSIAAFSLPGTPWDAIGGPDGNIWFTYGGGGIAPAIGRVELEQGGGAIVRLFHAGLDVGSLPREIVAGNGSYLWFNDRSGSTPAIGRVSMGGEIQEFTAGLDADSTPWNMVADANGGAWFTDPGTDNVGKVSAGGQITELGSGELIEPRYITAGPDGNMWFTYWGGIGKISPAGALTRLKQGLGLSANPQEIVAGSGGQLWFIANDWSAPAIGRIIPGDDTPPRPTEPARDSPQSSSVGGRLALRGTRILVSPGGKGLLHLACHGSTPCSGHLRLVGYRRGWGAGYLIWASPFAIEAGSAARVRIQLNRTGRKLVARGLEVTARLESDSGPTPLNRRLKLQVAPRGRSMADS